MKLEAPQNENYSATVVRIGTLVPLKADGAGKQDCDNVLGAPLLGYHAIVGKDTKEGTLGIVFTAETQLSEEYTKENNLYRHNEFNKDTTKAGYMEDNRRVKAMKFRGHNSSALFMPLESLAYTGVNVSEFNEGDTFDKLNGHEICRKHVNPREAKPRTEKNKGVVFKRVEEKFLPEHYDSDNYFRNKHVIKGNRQVIVTQKLHGTSIRIGNTVVKRKLSLRDRIAKQLGVQVAETEFDHVYGSRKVIKDANNPNQNHYYGSNIFVDEGKKYDAAVPENFILYGELIGWTSTGAPIQKNYTYRIPHGECELYVYRVAFVNAQGMIVDLAWEQVKEFCNERGLKHVPELWVGKHMYFHAEDWMEKNYFADGYKNAVPLADESPCDEGVCVRVDGMAPYILKAKSEGFNQHESKMKDKGEADIEEEEKLEGTAE